MLFVVALVLGAVLGTTGRVARRINGTAGHALTNRSMHAYITVIGALSNHVFPLMACVVAGVTHGFVEGFLVLLSIMAGAFLWGIVSVPHRLNLLIAVFVLPIVIVIFIANA